MNKKLKRSDVELYKMLKEQLHLLEIDCKIFDEGNELIGKHISVILRTLFHDTDKSHSILKKLNIKFIRWNSTVEKINPNNFLAECNFVSIHLKNDNGISAKYEPRFKSASCIIKKIDFYEWWTNPVVKDKNGVTFSRKDLILFIANKDGGAHIDSEILEKDKFLVTPNSLGWQIYKGEITTDLEGRAELICMRQIAYEVITTLKSEYKELFEL